MHMQSNIIAYILVILIWLLSWALMMLLTPDSRQKSKMPNAMKNPPLPGHPWNLSIMNLAEVTFSFRSPTSFEWVKKCFHPSIINWFHSGILSIKSYPLPLGQYWWHMEKAMGSQTCEAGGWRPWLRDGSVGWRGVYIVEETWRRVLSTLSLPAGRQVYADSRSHHESPDIVYYPPLYVQSLQVTPHHSPFHSLSFTSIYLEYFHLFITIYGSSFTGLWLSHDKHGAMTEPW